MTVLQNPQLLELVYMGLVPAGRGRGLGRELVRFAQMLASEANCEELTVAVDARNAPALAIYQRAGLVEFDRRRVLLKVL
jgi:ribosomal protein S18 acetylase RimI-like enzyme